MLGRPFRTPVKSLAFMLTALGISACGGPPPTSFGSEDPAVRACLQEVEESPDSPPQDDRETTSLAVSRTNDGWRVRYEFFEKATQTPFAYDCKVGEDQASSDGVGKVDLHRASPPSRR